MRQFTNGRIFFVIMSSVWLVACPIQATDDSDGQSNSTSDSGARDSATTDPGSNSDLSDLERFGELALLINEYRVDRGLPAIPLSPSLTFVAQTHVDDLEQNDPTTETCNAHSWSDQGEWTACCYTSDHAQAECMWDKPRELTDYAGDGFEIVGTVWGASFTAEAALEMWQGSPPHHDVIINQGIWTDDNWSAMGAAMSEHHAAAWFGTATDGTD